MIEAINKFYASKLTCWVVVLLAWISFFLLGVNFLLAKSGKDNHDLCSGFLWALAGSFHLSGEHLKKQRPVSQEFVFSNREEFFSKAWLTCYGLLVLDFGATAINCLIQNGF